MSAIPGASRAKGEAWRRHAAEDWEHARGRRLRVAELFLSLQGEGSRVGLPTVFLRLTGCALRCRWCDTAWAFHEGRWRTLHQLVEEMSAFGVRRACLTGGEPLLQPGVVPLARRLAEELGWDVVVETGGDQDISVLPERVRRILDVKLPGSGMAARMDPDNLARLRPGDEVKLVVADRRDYEEARRLVVEELAGFEGEVLISPVADELAPDALARWVLEDRLPVRLQLQLHKLIWPGTERGI